jgi:hypothetical protein
MAIPTITELKRVAPLFDMLSSVLRSARAIHVNIEMGEPETAERVALLAVAPERGQVLHSSISERVASL